MPYSAMYLPITWNHPRKRSKMLKALIREDIKLVFGDANLSLWKLAFDPTTVDAVRSIPINDESRINHLIHYSRCTNTPKETQHVDSFPPMTNLHPTFTTWATSTKKFAKVLEKQAEKKEKTDSPSTDKNLKTWEKLPEL